MALVALNVQGEPGPPGADGADGAGGAPAWDAATAYAAGALVTYEGQVWRATQAITSGYRTKPTVVTYVQTEHDTTGMGVKSIPAGITSAARSGDLYVLVTHANIASWGSLAAPSNMTLAGEQYGSTGTANVSGVRFHYAWHGGTAPSYNLGNATGRVTWLLVRGVNPTGDLTKFTGTENLAASAALLYTTATDPGASWSTALSLSAIALQHQGSASAFLVNYLPTDASTRIGLAGDMVASGGTLLGVVTKDEGDGSTAPYARLWQLAIASGSPTTLKYECGIWLLPALTNGSEFFDRTKWAPIEGAGAGDLFSLNTLGVDPWRTALPDEVDRRYSLDLNADFYTISGETTWHRLILPTPGRSTVPHWVDVTVNVPDGGEQRVYVRWFPATTSADMGAAFRHDGRLVEHDRLGPCSSTIRYVWDPADSAWHVGSWSGRCNVRDYAGWVGAQEMNLRVPLFFSPELQQEDDFAAIRDAHISALNSIDVDTRRVFQSAGVAVDLTRPKDRSPLGGSGEVLTEGLWRQGSSASVISGLVQTYGQYGYRCANATAWTASLLSHPDGRVMLHELGHALDYEFLTYRDIIGYASSPSGIDPTGPNLGYISSERTIVDTYASLTNKGTNYYRSTITEWFAQLTMIYWAYSVPGVDTAAIDSLKAEACDNNTSLYNTVSTYCVSIGAWQ